jgi:O-antigen/teichoic acid export membrane protein
MTQPSSGSVRKVSGTLAANLTLYVLAAATGPLAARLLGPDGRGGLAAIQLWPSAIATFAMLGLPESIAYFGARQPDRAGQWLWTSVVVGLAAACVATAIGYVAIDVGLRGHDPRIVHAAHRYLLLVLLTPVIGLPAQLARGVGRFDVWNAMRVAPALGWLTVLAAAWFSGSRAAETVATGYLWFLILEAAVIVVACVKLFAPPRRIVLRDAQTLLRYGLPSGLSAVPQFLNLRVDQMLIAAILPTRQLGLYVAAVSWSAISGVVLNAAAPVISRRLAVEPDVAVARSIFGRATRAAVIVSAITAGTFAIVTPTVMAVVYGSAFHEAVPIAVVLSVANTFVMINTVLEEGLRGLGDTATILKCEVVGFAATAVGLAALLHPMGIMGAAVASVAGYSAVTTALAVSMRRHDLTFDVAFRPRIADVRYVIDVAMTSWDQIQRLRARIV